MLKIFLVKEELNKFKEETRKRKQGYTGHYETKIRRKMGR